MTINMSKTVVTTVSRRGVREVTTSAYSCVRREANVTCMDVIPARKLSLLLRSLGPTALPRNERHCYHHQYNLFSTATSASLPRGEINQANKTSLSSSSPTKQREGTSLASSSSISSSLHDRRVAILNASLQHVHQHGWTENALSAGVTSLGLPPASVGLVSDDDNNEDGPYALVKHFMDVCNDQLRTELAKRFVSHSIPEGDEMTKRGTSSSSSSSSSININVSKRIEEALRLRLEMVIPYVKGKHWHEAMAMGAIPPNHASITAAQLAEMTNIISNAIEKESGGRVHIGQVERAIIGATYVATELHLLTDTSLNYADTWTFLRDRVKELEFAALNTTSVRNVIGNSSHEGRGGGGGGFALSTTTMTATTAVLTSLGGAVLSLAQPAARTAVSAVASTVVPQIMTVLQQQQQQQQQTGGRGSSSTGKSSYAPKGSRTSDYDMSDLPPFESEVEFSNGKQK